MNLRNRHCLLLLLISSLAYALRNSLGIFSRAINNLAQIYLIISSAIQLPNGIVIIVSTYQIKSNFVMQKSKKDCLKKKKNLNSVLEYNDKTSP